MADQTAHATAPGGKALSSERQLRYLVIVVMLAFGAGLARRLLVDWDTPLWLDETYTGAIAAQPGFQGLVRDCLHELGGPLYYLLMWAWEKLAGSSNLALRLPSLLFALAAPLVLLRAHPDRRVSMIWASLAALWMPGFYFATEARSYALLFFLACLQAVAVLRMARIPERANAVAWSVISALLILTHFHALIVTVLQAAAFLMIRRKEALRAWPAALVFIPVAAWLVFQVPFLVRFADPQVAWQPILQPRQLIHLPELLLGGGLLAILIVLAIAITAPMGIHLQRQGRRFGNDVADTALVIASLLAISLVFGMGFVRPSFSPRYLIPFMPGLLFGISLWASHWSTRSPAVPLLLILAYVAATFVELAHLLTHPGTSARWAFTWQIASRDLEAQGVHRLYFFLDSPAATIADRDQLARIAGFFLQRDGFAIPVEPISFADLPGRRDPNALLMTMQTQPGDAFIWAFSRTIRGTRAVDQPPRLAKLARFWTCRDYGRAPVTVLTCLRRPNSPK